MLDFTPVISLGLLTLVSSILNDIARSGKIYIGGILAGILSLVWSVGSTVYKIARPLTMGRPVDYKKALLLASAFLFAVLAAGSILIKILIGLCAIIPF